MVGKADKELCNILGFVAVYFYLCSASTLHQEGVQEQVLMVGDRGSGAGTLPWVVCV